MTDAPKNDYIKDAIKAAGLNLQTHKLRPEWYECRMVGRAGTMMREIQMRPGFGAPKLGSLVYHYACRAQLSQACEDILEWADETGEDMQASGTIEKYKRLVEDEQEFRLLLSESVFKDLMAALSIDQAIRNAMGSVGKT